MGLSGRKVKQRIPVDPRNLAWANDAAKFGSNYLSKFGWDSSKGLGVDGEGRTSHIKVAHKLDMLGIGAAHHHQDPNSIAWKQNKDFESVLKRLNDAAIMKSPTLDEEDQINIGKIDASDQNDIEGEEGGKRENKRKRGKDQEVTSEGKARKKRKRQDAPQADVSSREAVNLVDQVASAPVEAGKPYIPRHRAHRARAIASKSMSSKSEASIAEILGIVPTPSSSTVSGVSTPAGKLTSLVDGDTLETLRTSSKSMADYFKEKLSTKSCDSTITTPRSEVGPEADLNDLPRGGLGSAPLLRTKDVESHRIGVVWFSSLMSSTFLQAEPNSNDGGNISSKNERPEQTRRTEEIENIGENVPYPGEKQRKGLPKDPDPSFVQESGGNETMDQPQTKEKRRRLRAERKAKKRQSEQ